MGESLDTNLIEYHEEVFEPEFCMDLFKDAVETFTSDKAVWSSNYFWQGPLTADMFPWYIREYDKETADLILTKLHNKGILSDSEMEKEYAVMNYMGTRLAYIPWHHDYKYSVAVSIYLNDYWSEDWGGYYLYKDSQESNIISGYVPKFNTAIKNNYDNEIGLWHSVSTIAMVSKCPRASIQIFARNNEI